MLEKMLSEVVLEDEQVLIESIEGLHLVLLLDDFLPHAHELPALELLEEGKVLDVIVRVTLDEPLAQRHERNGSQLLVEGQTLARDRVVVVTFVLVGDWLQVVRITLVVALEVSEDGLLLASGVEKQLNVLVQLTPLLGLLRLLVVLVAEVVDHVGRLSVGLGLRATSGCGLESATFAQIAC